MQEMDQMQPETTNEPKENETNTVDQPAPVTTPAPQTTDASQQIVTSSYNPAVPKNPAGGRFAALMNNKRSKLILIAVATALLLGGGSAAAYFGYVVPNKPENLWKAALENTGRGYDKLVNYADSQKEMKSGKLTGTFKFDSKDAVVDGSIDSKFSEKVSTSKIDAGAAGARLNLELITNIADGQKNPDIYARVSGLKGIDSILGASGAGLGQSIEQYDNQWFVVDHTLLDQLEKSAGAEAPQTDQLSSKDIVDFAKSVGEVSKEYVFTANPDKAVFVVKENVGKEKLDNRDTYHYKAGIHKEHLKAYNKATCDKILESKVYKTLAVGQSAEELKKECYDTKDIDSIKESATADVWVDTKTKLVRKVRFTDEKNKENTFDVGLNYNGGDEYPFVFGFNSKEEKSEGKGTATLTLNTKKNTLALDVNAEGKEGDQPLKFTLKVTVEPTNDKVEFKKPEGAKSLMEAFGGLLGAGGLGGGAAAGGDQAAFQECLQPLTTYYETGNEAALPANCRSLISEQ